MFSIFLIFQSLQNLKVSKLFKLSWEIAEEIRNLGFEKDYDLIVLLSALPHAAGQCVGINSDRVFLLPMCFHDIFHLFYLISILVFQRNLVKKQSHKNSCSAHLEKFLPLFVLLALESFANILLCPELRPIESWKNSSKVVLF